MADADGALLLASLGVSLSTVAGPALRLTWPGGSTEVTAQI